MSGGLNNSSSNWECYKTAHNSLSSANINMKPISLMFRIQPGQKKIYSGTAMNIVSSNYSNTINYEISTKHLYCTHFCQIL